MIFYVSNGGRGTDASVKFKDMNEIRKSISKAYPGAFVRNVFAQGGGRRIPDGAVHPASVLKTQKLFILHPFWVVVHRQKRQKPSMIKRENDSGTRWIKRSLSVPVITKTDMHKQQAFLKTRNNKEIRRRSFRAFLGIV